MENKTQWVAAFLAATRKKVNEQNASKKCSARQPSRSELSTTEEPDHPLEHYSIHLYYDDDDESSQRWPEFSQETHAELITRLIYPGKPPLLRATLARRFATAMEASQKTQYDTSFASVMTKNLGAHPENPPDADEHIETTFNLADSREFVAERTRTLTASSIRDHYFKLVPTPVRGQRTSNKWRGDAPKPRKGDISEHLDDEEDVSFFGFEEDNSSEVESNSPFSASPPSPISPREPEPVARNGESSSTATPANPFPSREFRVMDEYLVPHVKSMMRVRARNGQPVPEIRECKVVSAAEAFDKAGMIEMSETLRVIRLPLNDSKVFDRLYWRNVGEVYFVRCAWDDEIVEVEVPKKPWSEWWSPDLDFRTTT